MASTCSIYKAGTLLGTGSCADGSASITSYSGTAPGQGRNITAVVTQAGTHVGRHWRARITAGSGTATLTLSEKCPYVGA